MNSAISSCIFVRDRKYANATNPIPYNSKKRSHGEVCPSHFANSLNALLDALWKPIHTGNPLSALLALPFAFQLNNNVAWLNYLTSGGMTIICSYQLSSQHDSAFTIEPPYEFHSQRIIQTALTGRQQRAARTHEAVKLPEIKGELKLVSC